MAFNPCTKIHSKMLENGLEDVLRIPPFLGLKMSTTEICPSSVGQQDLTLLHNRSGNRHYLMRPLFGLK